VTHGGRSIRAGARCAVLLACVASLGDSGLAQKPTAKATVQKPSAATAAKKPGAPAPQQQPPTPEKSAGAEQVRAEDEHVLSGRNRSSMHPGDPLSVVGREQSGNEVRSKTPALAKSDRVAALVDTEENYRRTLAMYESHAIFHTPLPIVGRVDASGVESSNPPTRTTPKPAPVAESGGGGGYWIWLSLIAVGAVLGVWMRKRRAPAATRPAAHR
jgi:hypothetical protein